MKKLNELYSDIIIESCYNQLIYQDLSKWKKGLITAGLLGSTIAGFGMNNKDIEKKDQQSYHYEQSEYKPGEKNQVITFSIGLIKKLEGCKKDKDGNLIVYKDIKGIPTIGYGETDKKYVKKGKISQQEATNLLKKRIENVYNNLVKELDNYFLKLGLDQQVALISLYYNIGCDFSKTPKLIQGLKDDDLQTVAEEFLDINKITVNGKKIQSKGLTNRRYIESRLFTRNLCF